MSLVSVVERSGDRKLTKTKNVSATWVPQQSCHDDCPLKNNGCYAEVNKSGLHTHRMNRRAKGRKLALRKLRLKLAKEEAAGIRRLSGTRKLRVHVVGDCADSRSANIVGRAMVEYTRRGGKAAWTYTHSWRRVPAQEWRGASVLASCERPEQVAEAAQQGYASVLITPYHPTNKVYQYAGLNIVPCPAQFKYGPEKERKVTCEDCNLCQDPDMLKRKNLVVGFQPDTVNGSKRILALIGADNGTV